MPRKYVSEAVPLSLAAFFTLSGSGVAWAPRAPLGASKKAPWGTPAGHKTVLWRGSLVSVSGASLLTSDIAFALEHGRWPWELGREPDHHAEAPHTIEYALSFFRLDSADRVVWAVDRGLACRAGDPAKGMLLSGPRGRMFTAGGVGVLETDLREALKPV